MKIISRYILKHFIPVFALGLFAFVGLYTVVDFFEKIDDILEYQSAPKLVSLYFLYKLPFIFTQGIPMATLLATLVSLGILNRNRELVALKASGVRALAYSAPIIAAAFFLSILDFGIGESVGRSLNQKAKQIWQENVLKKKSSVQWSKENVWYRGENLIYQIRLYDRRNQVMEKVSLFYLSPDFRLQKRMDAKRLRWADGRWVAEEGLILSFGELNKEQKSFHRLELHLEETPEDFSGIETIPAELSWLNLYRYTHRLRHEGYNAAPYAVELHLRIAFPATTLILALLGITISLRQQPQGGIAIGVGLAIIVAFIYLTLLQIGCSLGTAGILPPLLGVWAGNALFAIGAIYLWMITPQ